MNIAIDTNILVKAFCEGEPDHIAVTTFVTQRRHNLSFDFEGTICEEYQKNVGKSAFYQKWYKRLTDIKALHYYHGRLERRHKNRLCEFGCHEPTDHAFIAVAFNSDRHLISEDSDVGKGPKGNLPPHCHALRYLSETMGITVYDAHEACYHL